MTPLDLPTQTFTSPRHWGEWLAVHHSEAIGIWIKIAKKASGIVSITHDEALDMALCYGWIDGQRKSYDDLYFLQKFTPRRAGSLWSKRNIEKIAILIASNRIQPSGLMEIEAAKHDGRWAAAYDSPKNMEVPEDFVRALGQNKAAQATFDSLNRTDIYSIAWRLQTAKKPETRRRRLEALLAMLERGEKP